MLQDEDVIEDLKQFITTTVHGEVSILDKKFAKFNTNLVEKIDTLNNKVDNLSSSVAEAIDNFKDDVDKRLKKLELVKA